MALLRASAALTASYVVTESMRCGVAGLGAARLVVGFALTWADSTSVEWYAEWSPDEATWFRDTEATVSSGASTHLAASGVKANGASGNWLVAVPVKAPYVRFYVKKTGGGGADALAVSAFALA